MDTQLALDLRGYDFVDFGCNPGGSMDFARQKLGGGKGIGLDPNPEKVQASIAKGNEAKVAELTSLDGKKVGTVRFANVTSFLMNLPTADAAAKAVRSAVSVADEFVFIRQPFFDADDYLAALNLRLFWSNWKRHRYHMKANDFHGVLGDLLARRKIRGYVLFNRTKVNDSDDPVVHPMSSPPDQNLWQAGKHERKPFFKFNLPVYRETGALIHTRNRKLDEKPRRFLFSTDVFYDSKSRG